MPQKKHALIFDNVTLGVIQQVLSQMLIKINILFLSNNLITVVFSEVCPKIDKVEKIFETESWHI